MKKRRTGPVTIKFPNILLARAFHYQFKDFEWESDNSTQTIITRLQNEAFDAELVHPHVRLLVSESAQIIPEIVKSLTQSIAG